MSVTSATVFFTGPRQCVIRDLELAWPQPGQVLVQSQLSLISTGTELTLYSGDFPADSVWSRMARYPISVGYANIGVVQDVGPGVDTAWIGARVASRGKHATLNVLAPAEITRVPEGVSNEDAAFFTLVQTVMNGVRRSQVSWGEAVGIFGLGILGQLAVRFCRQSGAWPVFALDLSDGRLARLPQHDPGIQALNVGIGMDRVREAIASQTRSRMLDCGFEVTGLPQTIPDAMALLRKQGRFVLLSSPRGKIAFDFHDLCNSPSYTIIGTHGGSHPPVVTPANPWTRERHTEFFFDLVESGELEVASLLSRKVDSQEAPEIYRYLLEDRTRELAVAFAWM